MYSVIGGGRVTISRLALVVFAGLTAGCISDGQPTDPGSAPRPVYKPVPHDLCERLAVDEVAAQFDLTVPSSYEPSQSYFDRPTYSHTSCTFWTVNEEDGLATLVSRFEPGGSVMIEVFREPADAPDMYRRGADAFERGRESMNATLGPAEGWWDEGEYAESVRRQTINRFDQPDVVVSNIIVTYIAYHENLYLHTSLDATSGLEDVGEATAVLHDMVRTLMDEAVSHLTLTE